MKITEEQVRYVAALGNVTLTEEEVPKMAHDLDEILAYMEKLNAADTNGVEPMAQVLFEADETATLREDVEHHTLSNEDAVANAAVSGAGYFKVPLVIER